MINFVNAIKKPFADKESLLIGTVLGAIPIVNSLTVSGYGINSAKHADKKTLPDWKKDIVNHIIKSIVGLIVSLVYMIPALIIGIIMLGALISQLFGMFMAMEGGTDPFMFMDLGALGAGVIVFGILSLLALFLIPLALTRYALKDKVTEAFAFGKIIKRALTGEYIVAWIAYIVIAFVAGIIFGIIGMVLAFIPVIGWILMMLLNGLLMYYLYIVLFSMMGQLKWKD